MDDEFDGLGGSLVAAQDVLEAVLQDVDAAALRQLKAASEAWCAYARRELCNRLWVRLSRREGQPEPAGVDSITDLDVEYLNEAGRPWDVVVAGRQLPQLARLHGYGFVVDVQAVREASLEEDEHYNDDEEDDVAPLGGDTLRSCIQGEGQPPDELLLAAVACAASGTVRGVPVQRLREDDAIDELHLHRYEIGVTGATLLGLMLPAATSLRSLNFWQFNIGDKGSSALAAVLKETQITHLDLTLNELCGLDERCNGTYTAEGITKLCEALKGSAVTSLSLGSNQLCGLDDEGNGTYTTKGITKLCEGLKGSAVTSLSLVNNHLCGLDYECNGTYTAEGITKLCEGLKGSTVTSLEMNGNELCGVWKDYRGDIYGSYTTLGITKLCQELKGSAVTSLSLGGNFILVKGASALAAVLKETIISHLNLFDNDIGDKGASALAGVLKETQITTLNIGKNRIGAEGVSALAAVLKETKITTLRLDSNELCGIDTFGSGTYTAEGITKLCEGLKGSAVTSLDLEDNDLTNEAKQALQDAAGSSVRIDF